MGTSAVADLLERHRNGRTQVEYARDLGISQSQLSKLLSGKPVFGRKTAARIAARVPDLRDALTAVLLEVA